MKMKFFLFCPECYPTIAHIGEEIELQQMELENELYISKWYSVDNVNVETP